MSTDNTFSVTHSVRIGIQRQLPDNMLVLARDIAAGLERVYGVAGAQLYLELAPQILGAYVENPLMRFWSAQRGQTACAIVLTHLNETRGEISLVHRLDPGLARDAESTLLLEALRDLERRGAQSMLAEFVPTSSLGSLHVFDESGFVRVPREILSCAIGGADAVITGDEVQPLQVTDALSVGWCLAQAYAGDPGRVLHQEVQTVPNGAAFAERVFQGHFGLVTPGMNVALMRDGKFAGVALGCLLAPDVGFTLQVAVRPEYRGERLAQRLLEAQGAAFGKAGCRWMTLAVSRQNQSAVALYSRMGYRSVRDFNAYIWYREWPDGWRESISCPVSTVQD